MSDEDLQQLLAKKSIALSRQCLHNLVKVVDSVAWARTTF